MPKKLITHTQNKITSADTDMFERTKLSFILNMMIQGAIDSADRLGFGYEDLRDQRLFWVLNRITMEIYRPVRWKEKIVVETWPKDVHKILYLRDFIIRDEDSNDIAKATSAWLAIDFESKRPKRVEGILREKLTEMRKRNAIEALPEKLKPNKKGEIYENEIKYFDVDLNKHLTSSRYVDWMMDTFSPEFHEDNYPVKFSINFLKESKYGETIKLIRNQQNGKEYIFTGINKKDDEVAVVGKVIFDQ